MWEELSAVYIPRHPESQTAFVSQRDPLEDHINLLGRGGGHTDTWSCCHGNTWDSNNSLKTKSVLSPAVGLTSSFLAKDSTNWTFHSLASFLPISYVTTLCKNTSPVVLFIAPLLLRCTAWRIEMLQIEWEVGVYARILLKLKCYIQLHCTSNAIPLCTNQWTCIPTWYVKEKYGGIGM